MAEMSVTAAHAYDAYLGSAEGRLRSELVWQSLLQHLPARDTARELRALDAGGGTGELAGRLAASGFRTALLDPSTAMLALARTRLAGAASPVELVEASLLGGAAALPKGRYDVVTCHFVVEYAGAPEAAIRALAALASPGALLSVVTRNPAGEVLKHASLGAWEKARGAIDAASFDAALLGQQGALLGRDAVRQWLCDAGVEPIAERGLRVIAAAPPSSASDLDQLIALELDLSARSPFREIARYTHFLGRKVATREC